MPSEFERLQAALPKRYTLLRELDRGGMSRVYLAREEMPDRDVAIKVFDEKLSAQLGRERFVREVEVTSQLGHPHIVTLLAAGDADGTLYYVMPFIRGESLRDKLKREGRLPIDDALKITEQVAGALEHAHQKGIVHRDVKPANILFQSGHAVVADFGIARALHAAEAGGTLTDTGATLGTPDYMSPEQIGADQKIDGRTDTYGLACVLYEMLGGQPPFHSRTPQATLARQLTDTVPSLRALRDSVPQEIEDAIRKALSKAPADRYSSVVEFANALGQASVVSGPSAPWVARRKPSMSSLGTAVRLAAVLLVVAAVGVAWNAWSGVEPSSATVEPPVQESLAIMWLENLTGDPSFDNFGRLLATDVIGHFTEVSEILPINPHTIRVHMDAGLSIPELLEAMDVGYLIQGSYRFRGSDLVVNAQLTDARGIVAANWGFPSFPKERADSAGPEIAHGIVGRFLDHVGLSSVAFGHEGYSPATDAYNTGNSFLGQRTPAGMVQALNYFSIAIDLDETYAPAWAGRASAYALSMFYKYRVDLDGYELAAEGLAAADRAVEIDPTNAGGYAARGLLRSLLGMELELAQVDFRRARDRAPNDSNTPGWEGRSLAMQGRFGEAYERYDMALRLDPENVGRRIPLVSLAFELRLYDLVIEEALEVLRREATMTLATAFQGWALALLGRGEECLGLDFGVYDLVRAVCYEAAGRGTEGLDMVQAAETSLESTVSGGDYLVDLVAIQGLATYYGFVGNVAKATEWLVRAFDLSPDPIDVRILGSALFDEVRDDPDDPDDDPLFSETLERVQRDAREQVQAGRERLR